MATRVLVVSGDPIGPSMAGPAIRAVELTRVLAAAGHPVVLAAPACAPVALPRGARTVVAGEPELRALAGEADVVVAFAAVVAEHPWLGSVGAVLVVDAYDPGLLETLERRRGEPVNAQRDWVRAAGRHLVDPLALADAVLVANDRQRHLVVGILAALGRLSPRVLAEDPALDAMVRVVPFGTPIDPPVPSGRRPLRGPDGLVPEGATVALWGGGLHDWLDPVALVEAMAATERDELVAVFLAGPHPTPAVGRAALVDVARERARQLGLLGRRVVFHERWVPYAERVDWLTDADIGVSLHRHHLETELSFRTRVLDYLWAGLPVVCTEGDRISELVLEHGLGVVVPAGEPLAVAAALDQLAGADADQRRARAQRTAVVAARHAWPVVAADLVEICARPVLAADRRVAPPVPGRARRVVRAVRAVRDAVAVPGPSAPRW
jgi:glycosyltransferase involved in cell wall biosynthesis